VWSAGDGGGTPRPKQKKTPPDRGRRVMVEAAGQLIHLFRDGPDYAFILRTGCGACYPSSVATNPSTGSRRLRAVSQPMSLYRAGLRFAPFLPLGVAIPPAAFPPCGCRVRRCEPRYHSALTGRGDHYQSNPRPKTLHMQDYMLSLVIVLSPRRH
jgi:hypothetical protein